MLEGDGVCSMRGPLMKQAERVKNTYYADTSIHGK